MAASRRSSAPGSFLISASSTGVSASGFPSRTAASISSLASTAPTSSAYESDSRSMSSTLSTSSLRCFAASIALRTAAHLPSRAARLGATVSAAFESFVKSSRAISLGRSVMICSLRSVEASSVSSSTAATRGLIAQHFLYFCPLPHGHTSFRPGSAAFFTVMRAVTRGAAISGSASIGASLDALRSSSVVRLYRFDSLMKGEASKDRSASFRICEATPRQTDGVTSRSWRARWRAFVRSFSSGAGRSPSASAARSTR